MVYPGSSVINSVELEVDIAVSHVYASLNLDLSK